ncbi:MAG: hypothetical protein ACFFDS_10170 [Candidatus Thorarchaeota archaeon]
MSEQEDKNDFLPSSKIEEMNSSKVVIPERKKVEEIVPRNNEENKKITITYFVMEGVFALLALFFVISTLADVFLDVIAFIMGFLILSFGLVSTYLFIFKLSVNKRLLAVITRFILFAIVLPMLIIGIEEGPYQFYEVIFVVPFFLIIYSLWSQFLLKIYLLFVKKPIKDSLFRKAIAGSPSELEWRKYDSISGLVAIITGIFAIDLFWLIYHVLIRKILMEKAKRRLLVENLEFDKEVNLTPVSLELGLALEEVIFILKQMSLRRELNLEFTRFGVILKEIRKPKWFTQVMKEKYDTFVGQKKLSEIELKAMKFFDLAERNKLQDLDFKKIMGIKEEFPIEDLVLILPHRVIEVKKVAFSKKRWIFFNLEQTLLKKEKIIKAFVDNSSSIFNS